MMIESMAGKSASMHGLVHDATPFTFSEDNSAIDYFGKMLVEGKLLTGWTVSIQEMCWQKTSCHIPPLRIFSTPNILQILINQFLKCFSFSSGLQLLWHRKVI